MTDIRFAKPRLSRLAHGNWPGLLAIMMVCAWSANCLAIDTVELVTGAVARGTIKSYSGSSVVMEVKIGNRTLRRSYPKDRIRAITVDGKKIDLNPDTSKPSPSKPSASTPNAPGEKNERSRAEILADVDRLGRTPPDWYESTALDYPKTLDLAWPTPPPKGWDSSRNVGQFLWDRINPNTGKWREGVRLMHHILTVNKDRETQKRAMRTLGTMYHNLLQDHHRAAFWFRQSGLENELSQHAQAGVFLADTYWKLGSKRMAMETLAHMPRKPYLAIKLLGDLGETDLAVKMAEQFSRGGEGSTSFLYAGDACRVAGRLADAEKYYRRAIAAIEPAEAGKPHRKRDRERAEASIAAIRFYSLDPKNVADGTYKANSIGYEGQVHVEVVVVDGRIESVRVTQHREKQYYSALTDTPKKIVDRQRVAGIDATSSATITSEAIINATAKALASGLN
ncbi:MAG: FMN-binding protein [Planctomycetota bacterium]|nr:FMN-binding protein [Planctomycetota bacterium]